MKKNPVNDGGGENATNYSEKGFLLIRQ